MIFRVFTENVNYEDMKKYSTVGFNVRTYTAAVDSIKDRLQD